MNKEQLIRIIVLIYKSEIILLLGLSLLFFGLGATYQAQHDVKILNSSLYEIATTNQKLTDGNTYYYVGLYSSNLSFSENELINRSQCERLYGYGG